jgi:hypothetical protein
MTKNVTFLLLMVRRQALIEGLLTFLKFIFSLERNFLGWHLLVNFLGWHSLVTIDHSVDKVITLHRQIVEVV